MPLAWEREFNNIVQDDEVKACLDLSDMSRQRS